MKETEKRWLMGKILKATIEEYAEWIAGIRGNTNPVIKTCCEASAILLGDDDCCEFCPIYQALQAGIIRGETECLDLSQDRDRNTLNQLLIIKAWYDDKLMEGR